MQSQLPPGADTPNSLAGARSGRGAKRAQVTEKKILFGPHCATDIFGTKNATGNADPWDIK